jgi:replicative DNA helicase
MKLQAAVQEALLALLCYDPEAGAEVAMLVEPRDFDPVYREVAEQAMDYRHRHGQAPGEHTLDLFEAAKERKGERGVAFDRLLESVESTAKEINPAYVLERAAVFVRFQRLMVGVQSALRDMQRDDEDGLLAAEAKLHGALKDTIGAFDVGLRFADDLEASVHFLTAPEESIPTGIPEIDKRGLGPSPGRLHMLMADTGRGKSWWLIHLAAEALKYGKRVLYVTLEMSEDEVALRMVQRIGSFTKRHLADGVPWEEFLPTGDVDSAGSRRKRRRMEHRPSFADDDAEARVRRKLRTIAGQGQLIIKDFPQGTLAVQPFDDYLTVLEERERFIPDLILIDYVDIMRRASGIDRWQAVVDNTEGVRSIAQRRRVAIATVSQVNASGIKAKQVGLEHMPGAKDKSSTVDVLLTYSQTAEEEMRGLARLWVAKGRQEEAHFGVLISQAYAVGQFVMDSSMIGSEYDQEDEGEVS